LKNFKSHFKFNTQERSGIFFLLLLLALVQIARLFVKEHDVDRQTLLLPDATTQAKIDVLKRNQDQTSPPKNYPFNPNFITDYKGYLLGMSLEELDRLHQFRAKNKFVDSKEAFQKVTLVSDSLLADMAPYFKFPDWVAQRRALNKKRTQLSNESYSIYTALQDNKKIALNTAKASDLRRVNGIGEKLAARIIKFRDKLGGFVVKEQLYDVYGLEETVVKRAFKIFDVKKPPEINKIPINLASVDQLAKLVYISRNTAQSIVDFRERNGRIVSFDELSKIDNFPANKIKRIGLYLSLKID